MTKPTRREENKLYKAGYKRIAGVDEAGRGAWAGPLVAAAVILPKNFRLPGLNDSKKVVPRRREILYRQIIKKSTAYQVHVISHKRIDKQGVGQANLKAIKESVRNLPIKPDFVLVDGFKIEWNNVSAKGIIKGDAKVVSIAAASIIAKVTRDRLMVRYHQRYPRYGFHKHKGYGTSFHYQRVLRYGLCPLHRRSFAPIKKLIG